MIVRIFGRLAVVAAVVFSTIKCVEASYVSAVLADNPLVYYRLQETGVVTSDIAVDTSVNGNDGTYTFVGSGSMSDSVGLTPELTPGKQFNIVDGNGAYVDVPAIGGALNAFSVEFFIKPNSATYTDTDLQAIYASTSWGAGRLHVNINPGGALQLAVFGNDPWPSFDLPTYASEDEWTHVVLTFEISGASNTVKFYTDGVERASATTAGSNGVDFSLIGSVGRWDGTGRYLKGAIDEFAIYGGALSDTEVAAHFAAIPEPSSLALLACGAISMFLIRRKR